MFLAFVCWIVTGLLTGFIASKLARLGDDDPRLGIAAGGIGGLVAGILFSITSSAPATAFNAWSIVAAAAGAAAACIGWYGFRAYSARA